MKAPIIYHKSLKIDTAQHAELVILTYGSIVAQLCKDYEGNYAEVNKQLDQFGYNIGLRLIEDFLAKSNMTRCSNFRETAEAIAKVRNWFLHPFQAGYSPISWPG
jgi:uncharacterized protein YjaZ